MKKKCLITLILFGGIIAMAFLFLSTGLGLVEVKNDITLSLEGIEVIQVNMTSENIHLYNTDNSSEIRFYYYGRSFPSRELVTEIINEKLLVKHNANYWVGNLKLDIYLPANYNHAISIKTTSGDVALEPITLSQFFTETTSGKLSTDTVKASSVSIQTTSGLIDMKNIEAKKLQVSMQSGNLIIGNSTVNEMNIKSSSANVSINSNSGNCEIKTTSGLVSLIYPEFNKNKVNVMTTSGEISLGLPLNAGFSLDAHNTSGTIQSGFPLLKIEKHAASGQIGSGEGQIILSATSGNIDINIKK